MTENNIAIIERIYDCPEGLGVRFTRTDGQRVRIEPRNQAVVVGWETQEELGSIAVNKLLSMTKTAKRIVFIQNPSTYIAEGFSDIKHPKWHYITKERIARADLVRIDSAEVSVVSEKVKSDLSHREISVITRDFESAARLIHDLGAEALSSQLPELAIQWRSLFSQNYLTDLE